MLLLLMKWKCTPKKINGAINDDDDVDDDDDNANLDKGEDSDSLVC